MCNLDYSAMIKLQNWRIAMFLRGVFAVLVPVFAVAQDMAAEKPPAWGARSGRYQLSIASDKTRYQAREPIIITVLLKNVSDLPVQLRKTKGMPTYTMEVLAPSEPWMGWRPRSALKPLGESTTDLRRVAGTVGVDIAPGRELTDHYEINALYEMSAPGDYLITFQCRQPTISSGERDGKDHPLVEVTSNQITGLVPRAETIS
jgi:hypothetical protein